MRKPKTASKSTLAQTKSVSRTETTRKTVQVALDHYAHSRNYAKVLSLYGTGGVAKGYDPKATMPMYFVIDRD